MFATLSGDYHHFAGGLPDLLLWRIKVSPTSLSTASSTALSWERFEDPVQIHMAPEERVDVNDLIRTDNDLLNRVMVVFAYLCDEVKYLEQTAEDTFYKHARFHCTHCLDGEAPVKRLATADGHPAATWLPQVVCAAQSSVGPAAHVAPAQSAQYAAAVLVAATRRLDQETVMM